MGIVACEDLLVVFGCLLPVTGYRIPGNRVLRSWFSPFGIYFNIEHSIPACRQAGLIFYISLSVSLFYQPLTIATRHLPFAPNSAMQML